MSVPMLTFVLVWMFFSALASTGFGTGHPWIAGAVGIAFGVVLILVPLGLVLALVSRLHLFCEDFSFRVTIRIWRIVLFRKSIAGRSWHAIATPGRSFEHAEFTSYRVEVAAKSGERIRVLGPLLCWLYRVECL